VTSLVTVGALVRLLESAVGDFVAVLPAREQYTGQPWIGKCLEYDTVQKKAKIVVSWQLYNTMET